MSEEQKEKIRQSNRHKHKMTKAGSEALSKSKLGKSPSNKGKICMSNINSNIKIYVDVSKMEEYKSKGYILGDFINKISVSNWYKDENNKKFHRQRTSEGTKIALKNPKIREKLKSAANINRFMKVRRKNWHTMTEHEKFVSKFLLDLGFEYQKRINVEKPNKFYMPDFVNEEHKIIIELDGKSHNNITEKEIIRTKLLENLGYKIYRFKNKEVYENNFKNTILDILKVGDDNETS